MQKIRFRTSLLLPLFASLFMGACSTLNSQNEDHLVDGTSSSSNVFASAEKAKWNTVFFDSGEQPWTNNWVLDGTQATITNSARGMEFFAGPKDRDDSHHAVLWTKKNFNGDLKIEYEYTKLDDMHKNVTIIYLLATGMGTNGYEKDIFTWSDKRQVPSMRHYFNHMNLYHISYAAYATTESKPEDDYIRARRYMPSLKPGLQGTDLEPDYFQTGLFKKDVTYKVTIIKKDSDLFMRIRGGQKTFLSHWKTDATPNLTEGRIGLRHMFTRGARYYNFSVSELE